MRVYGALMWSLGKVNMSCYCHVMSCQVQVLTCPEVPRVYIGSWWDRQLRHAELRRLFEMEEQDLFRDFRDLPRGAALRCSVLSTPYSCTCCNGQCRKLNDLIKRARLARVLALVVEELHGAMPLLRRDTAKRNLLAKLDSTVRAVEVSVAS